MPKDPIVRTSLAAALLAFSLGVGGCVDQAMEHRVRANAFLRGGDAAAALKECDDGLAGKKTDLPLLILRGKALFELDRLDDARAAYEVAVAAGAAQGLEPSAVAEARLGLAMADSRQKDWSGARKEFEALVAINPRDATSHLNVARACLELKDIPCALSHGEEAGKLRGNEESVLYTLGTIYLAANQPGDAERTFQRICEVVPGASSCPYGVALVAARAGDKPKALAELKKAVERKLPNPGQVAVDPGFVTLRDDAEFKALAAKATGGAP